MLEEKIEKITPIDPVTGNKLKGKKSENKRVYVIYPAKHYLTNPKLLSIAAGNLKPKSIKVLIRPTGLIDPVIDIKSVNGQINDLVSEIVKRKKRNERVLVTTLTKKMAEVLTDYLNDRAKIEQVQTFAQQVYPHYHVIFPFSKKRWLD